MTAAVDLLNGVGVGPVMFLAALAAAFAVVVLRSPVIAAIALLIMLLARLPLMSYLPVDAFWCGFVLLAGATLWWWDRTVDRSAKVGAVECAMALYLLWNVWSMMTPHQYDASAGLTHSSMSVPRFIVTGALMPFVFYTVGRLTVDRPSTLRVVLWVLLAMAGYSAFQAILQFHGGLQWMWPRYDTLPLASQWTGRAAGPTNQPVENGILLALGIAIAVPLIDRGHEVPWRRALALVIATACGYALYLTHTRAAWLCGVVVLVLGVGLAKGYRRGFVASLGLILAVVVVRWSVFTSADRNAGGVGSEGELQDRLNSIRTALWAAGREPLAGWGIGRFQSVNTHHHLQWSAEVPWIRGYGIVAHSNELGILAELGLVGLVLWLGVVGLIAHRLWIAYRILPEREATGKPLAVTAIMALAVLVTSGLTVDLRFLDFGSAVVFFVVGIAVGWCDRYSPQRLAPSVNPSPAPQVVNSHG